MITDAVLEEAHAENAAHDERREQVPGREYVTDLAEAQVRAGPRQRKDHVPVGARFLATDQLSTDPVSQALREAQDTDPADAPRIARKAYRENPRVADLVNEGHGFSVQRFSNPDRPVVCRYCGGRLLSPAEVSPCEFEVPERPEDFPGHGPEHPAPMRVGSKGSEKYGVKRWFRVPGGWRRLKAVPTRAVQLAVPSRSCRCNGCQVRRDGVRKRGGPRVQCGAEDCRKALDRDRSRKYRRRQKNVTKITH